MKQPTARSSKRIPKLRFPEFQDAPEWNEEKFVELYSLKGTNTLSRDKLNYDSGLVKNIHYGDIHTKFSTLFRVENEDVPFINPSESLQKIKKDNYCQVGDMVFADASEDLEDVGKSIEITSLNGEKVVSGLHTILARQKGKRLISGFGGHLFKSKRLREQIQREAQGAKVLGISGRRLSNIDVGFPADESEQQRITDCLSSLDKWIEAEAKQLDTLKGHKKGLMQQLFPAEGETTPKLRFPEFQDEPEWEKGALEDVSERVRKRISVSKLTLDNYISTENILPDFGGVKGSSGLPSVKTVTQYKMNDVLLANIRPYLKKVWFSTIDGGASNDVIVFRPKGIDPIFHSYVLRNEKFINYVMKDAKGVKMPRGDISSMMNYPVPVPLLNEQKCIANCLSSLDRWIRAQEKRIEALQEFKQGLMQQLFPSSKEGSV